METKILLVEFVIVDRFHCGISFPYFQGILKEKGLKTFNVRFGLKAAEAMLGENDGATLSSKDLNNLREICDKFKPTHILFSHKPANFITKKISTVSPNIKLGYDTDSTNIKTLTPETIPTTLFQWLNHTSKTYTKDIFSFEKPDFISYSANKLAGNFRPLPFLRYGTDCNYNKSITKIPYFKDLDLSKCIRKTGCTFCMRPHTSLRTADSFVIFKNQLKQAYETCNWGKHNPRYRILGEEIFHQFEKVAKMVDNLCFKNSDFLFGARADYIVKFKTEIEKGIKILEKNKNRFQLCLIGIENFSEVELERMNKGITTETIIKMIEILRKLERKYPTAFDYKEYGGFSTILYTPWTTLEDIEFNLAMITHLNIENLCGKLLTSRLRLYPELPLTKLAEKDDLLIDEYNDPLFNTSKRNFYPDELPWRFKEPKVEIFNKIATRLVNDNSLVDDDLYILIQNWYQQITIENKTPVSAAKIVLKEIKNKKYSKNIQKILYKIQNNIKPIHKTNKKYSFYLTETEYLLIKKRVREVGRIENVPIQKAKTISCKLQKIWGNTIKVKYAYNLKYHSSNNTCDIFYGFDETAIEKTIELTGFFQKSMDVVKTRKAIEKIGLFLGYPKCCSKNYSLLDDRQRHYNEWLHLHNRVKECGEVLPVTNPFTISSLIYIPCSSKCKNTINLVQFLLKEIVELRKESIPEEINQLKSKYTVEEILEECKKPVFFLLDTPFCCVRLEPLTTHCKSFSYKPIEKFGNDERLNYVMQGNSIEIKKGCISIYSKGEKLHDFFLNAYVWWYKKAFYPEFWELCARNFHKYNDTQHFEEKSEKQHPKQNYDKPITKIYNESLSDIENFLTKSCDIINLKTGFEIRILLHIEQREIKVLLENQQEKLKLIIEPIEIVNTPFMRGQYYAISHNVQTPVKSESAINAVRFILKFIDTFKAKQKLTLSEQLR